MSSTTPDSISEVSNVSEDSEQEMDHDFIFFAAAASATVALITNYFQMYILNHVDEQQRQWTGEEATNAILHGPGNTCFDYIHMHKSTFLSLRDRLRDRCNIQNTPGVSLEEQLMIFLHTLSHRVKNRILRHQVNHSGETISRYFNKILNAIIKLHSYVMKQAGNEVPPQILNNSRFYPYFQGCVGAIDSTDIPAMVPFKKQGNWLNSKGSVYQNILASCSFDLKFQYVVAGWEGSVADSIMLSDALSRADKLIIPPDGWEKCWEQGLTPWDLRGPTPVILDLLKTRALPKGRVLVPGCGSGYDVIAIASPERYVVGLDISDNAIRKAREVDFFTWHSPELFDLIFDYTFFCAIEPSLRPAWASQIRDLLKPDGELITLMFPMSDHVGGPPYKVSVSDYEEVLHPVGFKAVSVIDNELAIAPRKGREKLGRWKKSSLTKSCM